MEPSEKSNITKAYHETGTEATATACPSDCAPGIKCDHCGPRGQDANSAEREPQEAEAGNSLTVKYFTASDVLQSMGSSRPFPVASFGDESTCSRWLIIMLHGAVPHCPECGLTIDGPAAAKFFEGERCICKACGRSFSAKTGTFLQGMHMEFRQIFLLAVLIDLKETGITPQRIADMVGISADTVRLWIEKFKAFEDHGR